MICGDETDRGHVAIDRLALAAVRFAEAVDTPSISKWNDEPGRSQADAVAGLHRSTCLSRRAAGEPGASSPRLTLTIAPRSFAPKRSSGRSTRPSRCITEWAIARRRRYLRVQRPDLRRQPPSVTGRIHKRSRPSDAVFRRAGTRAQRGGSRRPCTRPLYRRRETARSVAARRGTLPALGSGSRASVDDLPQPSRIAPSRKRLPVTSSA
jgi:hypothetical protein